MVLVLMSVNGKDVEVYQVLVGSRVGGPRPLLPPFRGGFFIQIRFESLILSDSISTGSSKIVNRCFLGHKASFLVASVIHFECVI